MIRRPPPAQQSLFADAAPPPAPRERPARSPRDRRFDGLPDVRDGLTRVERIVLVTLAELERELPGRDVPSAMLYGRLAGRVDLTPDEMQTLLGRLGARRYPGR